MKNRFLLIRAKFLQKILLIKKLYVPVSMKINQSKYRNKYIEHLCFFNEWNAWVLYFLCDKTGKRLPCLHEQTFAGQRTANSKAVRCLCYRIAQVICFLRENGLTNYEELSKKTDEMTARFNQLSETIKISERCPAQIAVLRTYIIYYSKTRNVYVVYRKAGYSRKFYEAHREEIILHRLPYEKTIWLNFWFSIQAPFWCSSGTHQF